MSFLKSSLAAASFAFVATVASAQTAPNLSGQWAMNAAKSDFGPVPAPSKVTIVVDQSATVFKFTQTVATPNGDQTITQEIPLGPKEATWTAGDGGPVTSTTSWDGNTLVINAKLQRQGADITQVGKWTLSPDGRMLTLVQQSASPMGSIAVTIVCDRK